MGLIYYSNIFDKIIENWSSIGWNVPRDKILLKKKKPNTSNKRLNTVIDYK